MMIKKTFTALILTILVNIYSPHAFAVLTIEITQGLDGALPIAVMPFQIKQGDEVGEDVAAIIAADLHRSGRFAPLADEKLPDAKDGKILTDFMFWRMMAVDHLVVGNIVAAKDELYTVQFQLFDVIKGEQVMGYSMTAKARQLRKLAHRVSDLIFEKLTGTRGAFDTKIAYITMQQRAEKKQYSLAIADADGHNEQILLTSAYPLMSPSWSPDGKQLAYVSFEKQRPYIYIQNVYSGKRRLVAKYKGLNNAPVWSPDGKKLALTLSRDGNAEIYVLNLQSNKLHRVTRHYAIDTEAAWSPDGESLIFTSDRGGRPQLYQVLINRQGRKTGRPSRISFKGNYNSRASYSNDGKYLTFVHGVDGRFKIAVMELGKRSTDVVADTRLGESPSFAPNSAMVIYAAEKNGKGVLEAVSVDGRARQRLGLQSGDVREPAWSPYMDEK